VDARADESWHHDPVSRTPHAPSIVRLRDERSAGAIAWLERGAHAVLVGQARTTPECARDAASVLNARDRWLADFAGEQFALGRAFYTHLETGRAAEYFSAARAADAEVEAVLPGLQARMRALYGRLVGGVARPRLGFCGAGVHVFPAGGRLARTGGVVHWDVEGLPPLALERAMRAVTLVLMLQPAAHGGGLRVWDATWDGHDEPDEEALARSHRTLRYLTGDAMLMSSYRLHQIRPFRGERDRLSVTLHGVEVDHGVWDTWF